MSIFTFLWGQCRYALRSLLRFSTFFSRTFGIIRGIQKLQTMWILTSHGLSLMPRTRFLDEWHPQLPFTSAGKIWRPTPPVWTWEHLSLWYVEFLVMHKHFLHYNCSRCRLYYNLSFTYMVVAEEWGVVLKVLGWCGIRYSRSLSSPYVRSLKIYHTLWCVFLCLTCWLGKYCEHGYTMWYVLTIYFSLCSLGV